MLNHGGPIILSIREGGSRETVGFPEII